MADDFYGLLSDVDAARNFFIENAVGTHAFKTEWYEPGVHVYFEDGTCCEMTGEEWKKFRGW